MSMVLVFGLTTQAATWENTSTGSFITGTTNTGIVYTWSLLTYLTTQKSIVNVLLSGEYNKFYDAFLQTWINILRSVEYKSLVCLWAIKDESLLSQLQKDKAALMIAFEQDFIELQNQILSLEEKQTLQTLNNITMFDSGTTYETEKIRIKNNIDTKVTTYKDLIRNFTKNYAVKKTEFLNTYAQYRTANSSFLKTIQDKLDRVQSIITAFSWVESTITAINAKITGLDDLLQKMEDSKTKGITNLDTSFQSLIDKYIKKYKKLQTLEDVLTQQKTYLLQQYKLDFDGYMNNNFKNRYDRNLYLSLKDEIDTFRSKFYIGKYSLNCSNILSPNDESTNLLIKINTMKATVNSGLVKITAEGVTSTFKDQLYSGFQSLYLQKFKQRYAEFSTYIKEYIKAVLKNLVSSTVSTPTSPITPTITYVFTKPFTSGEYGEWVKALQNLLTTLQLYSWAIDGIYNTATKNAVYKFQLSKWLLKGYEKKPATWWWMGPATRNALNQLTK